MNARNPLALGVVTGLLTATLSAAPYKPDLARDLGFPVYRNAPAGRQLSGAHAPAASPALAPAESQKAIQLPPGFQARLFAAEPWVVNPVAMTWDDRGRLWVLELYEYPKGAPQGATPRDRIKILEDTDADGVADKVSVWADNLNLACGLLLGHGGAYVGAAPDFLFLEDADNDGRADKRTVLKTGFGLHDRHELLNGFTWGPDGWLYMTHGVFTHSKVKNPDDPNDDGVVMDAAVGRYHPRTKKFEVFADGTSNPWGVDFDRDGHAFVSACVIPHFFHMAPGGLYQRQGGQPAYPYGYGLLPPVVDYLHYRAAHAGVQIYQGNQYPRAWQGIAFLGNIHQSALNVNRLTPMGASFKGSKPTQLLGEPKGDYEVGGGNFLVSKDPWFRPVSIQTGPDGALWVMDWYDRYPCYQNAQADPEGVDREHGRIWRIVHVGDDPARKVPSRPDRALNLAGLGHTELVALLDHPNSWQRRSAQRVLGERRAAEARPGLLALFGHTGKPVESRLAALWTLHTSDQLNDATLDSAANDAAAPIRMWAARLTGERHIASEESGQRLVKLASDPEATVRSGVATAVRQYTSGSLTVNTPPASEEAARAAAAIVAPLVLASAEVTDPLLGHQFWMAGEPQMARTPDLSLDWLVENGPRSITLSAQITRKLMRRICDQTDADTRRRQLAAAVHFLDRVVSQTALAGAAFDGLLEGFKNKGTPPEGPVSPVLEKYYAFAGLGDKARRLGVLWGDPSATTALIARSSDTSLPLPQRLEGIQAARESRSPAARDRMLGLLGNDPDQTIRLEALRALGEIGAETAAEVALSQWDRGLSPATRRAAAEVLVTRPAWARALLAALGTRLVSRDDLSATALRALSTSPDAGVRELAARSIGKFRATADDKLKLIAARKQVVLAGEPDPAAGREIARKTCLVCHKLHGEGAGEVGPDLTGVGRSTLDALLANIIDPNQVIGAGYENVLIDTIDGRTLSGRLVENTDNRVRLVSSGPKEETIARRDIAVINGQPAITISDSSVMPEGLEQMPEADFRNMIWFLLNPPEDKRPWTPQLRRELIGDEVAPGKKRAEAPAVDGESVALWNPDWRVMCPPVEGAPAVQWSYAGRRNVLLTHPADRSRPAALERVVPIPAGRRTTLKVDVASHERGDWELRVVADGKVLHRQTVRSTPEQRWQQVKVDLSPLAGKTVTLRLENAADGWSWEFGYWGGVELTSEQLQAAR